MTRVPRLTLWTAVPASALLLLGAAAESGPPWLLVNESPSLPEGVYLRRPAAPLLRGALVAAPQPAVARAYLGRLGMPAEVALLKRVAAVSGDRVCAEPDAIAVAGRRVPVRAVDRLGRALPRWSGCRTLGPDDLFLLGDTSSSFDSRYFGPVRRTAVSGPYREILTW
jgi:conjugative transfer signal peptidase TraF